MPSADQLAGVAAYRKARSRMLGLERAQLDALTEIAQLERAIDAALAAGRDEDADALRVALRGAQARRDKADAGRTRAAQDMRAGRTRAVAKGAGFDLLSASHPFLLLPVRLETRFAWEDAKGNWAFAPDHAARRALLVRVFPDELHEDAHEPELTPAEAELLAMLAKRLQAARDLRDLDLAWTDAMREVGPTRAGWLGDLIARGGGFSRRPSRQSRPSVARMLPDCWVAFAELDDGSVLTAQSGLVNEPLETGPSPDGMAWMTDFGAALDAGMALVVADIPAAVEEVRRLTVVGARGTLDPDETAYGLEALLAAHHYTDGLALLAPGTPTNSLPGDRAGATTRPRPQDVVAIDRRRFMIGMRPQPLCQPGDDTDGSALAALLGIRTDAFAYVECADATVRREGIVLRRLLATATRRHLSRLLADGVLDASGVDEVLGYAVELVSASGPAAALRVGSQPYGILPILLRDDARLAPASLASRALPVLDALRAHWEQAAAALAWIGDPGPDAAAMLIRMLQRDAVARSIVFRPLLGPDIAHEALGGGAPNATAASRRAAATAIDALGAADAARSRLLGALHMTFAAPLAAAVVELEELELVASLRPDLLALRDYGDQAPASLLFAIGRLAMLERVDLAARAAHIAAGADPARWDDETVPSEFTDPLGTPLRRLQAPDPLDPVETTAFHLSEQGRDAGVCADVRFDVRWLKGRPAGTLEEQLRASLGLFGHRLDPWYTALATERLLEVRNSPGGERGVGIGGFGIVEHIATSPRRAVTGVRDEFTNPFNGGYVHAPSANHGATASVLRSVHLAHAAAGHGDAFSVDLSSARVRTALELLEGIREGQPLAALLGYRIERLLAREGLQRLMAPLRRAAPLVAHRLTPGSEPADRVAASTVCDGLTVLSEAGYDGRRAATTRRLLRRHRALGPLSAAEQRALDRVLQETADAVDAVADLVLAESVHHAVQGNPARYGAAADGLAGSAPPAPDPGVIATPRTGVGVTHRLVVLLGDPDQGSAGWVDTPRALAEPRLEAWARTALPAPEHIVLRARFVNDAGDVLGTLDHLDLETLNAAESATTPVGLGALDLVLQADPSDEPQAAPLEVRLAALVEELRPAAVGDARLEVVVERHAGWGDDDYGLLETLEIARQLHVTLGCSRPLDPGDLSALDAAAAEDPAIAAELAGRASTAAGGLATAGGMLHGLLGSTDAGALRGALFGVDRFGVPGATPLTISDPAGASAEAADERARRLAALQQQAAIVDAEVQRRVGAAGAAPAADASGRLAAIFGESFVALPSLGAAGTLLAPLDAAAAPDGAEPAALRAWLARAARVREAVGALDATLAYADARVATDAAAPAAALHVAQLGGPIGERWVALEPAPGAAVPGGRISCVAVTPDGALPSGVVAGLLVDEWVEVVPSPDVTTSVAFHCDSPGATAPQALLLAVAPPGREAWTAADARAIVHEALDLARLRLVELDDLQGLGQLLPAFVTGENPEGDEISLEVAALTEPAP